MSSQFLYDYLARTGADTPPVQRNQATIALLCWNIMTTTQHQQVYTSFVSRANNLVYS